MQCSRGGDRCGDSPNKKKHRIITNNRGVHAAMPQKSKTAAVTVPDFVAGVGKVNKRGRAKVVITPLDGYAAATNVAWVTLTTVLIAYTLRTFVHPVLNGDIVNPE